MTNMVFIVKYAPVGLVDGPRIQAYSVNLPEDGYGAGFNHSPELNKIYDPNRPRYPGWWVHMFIKGPEQKEEAIQTIQTYLLTKYGVEVKRNGSVV